MNAIQQAIDAAGGVSRLAECLRVTPQAVCFYRDGKRRFPVEFCAPVHVRFGVARWALRPDDWHLIWPELVGTEGAPDVPQAQATDANSELAAAEKAGA